MRSIDPVVIREMQARETQRANRMHVTRRALEGLRWFGENALRPVAACSTSAPREVDPNTLVPGRGLGSPKVPALIVASATVGVEAAAHYINAAFTEMRAAILTRAVEMAQGELDDMEKQEAGE